MGSPNASCGVIQAAELLEKSISGSMCLWAGRDLNKGLDFYMESSWRRLSNYNNEYGPMKRAGKPPLQAFQRCGCSHGTQCTRKRLAPNNPYLVTNVPNQKGLCAQHLDINDFSYRVLVTLGTLNFKTLNPKP